MISGKVCAGECAISLAVITDVDVPMMPENCLTRPLRVCAAADVARPAPPVGLLAGVTPGAGRRVLTPRHKWVWPGSCSGRPGALISIGGKVSDGGLLGMRQATEQTRAQECWRQAGADGVALWLRWVENMVETSV